MIKECVTYFFDSIEKLLKECSLGLKLIAGDYNQALAKIDRVTKKHNLVNIDNSTSELHKLIKMHNLNDIWRDIYKNKMQYTWRRLNGIEKRRIDF